MGAELGPNRYGKAGIHVATVVRHDGRHDFSDRIVDVRIEGDFETVYREGDNSPVLPTDTMRGAVFALSADRPEEPMETFALRFCEYLLGSAAAAKRAQVWVTERPWRRISIDGDPHPHAFELGAHRHTAHAIRDADGATLAAGVIGLSLLKTTGSAFTGFMVDRYTTLAEAEDRILATEIRAEWRYADLEVDYVAERHRAQDAIVRAFVAHDESRSVQHTLWHMGTAVLEACPLVTEISFSLPNLHHILADLSPYGLENDGVVFTVTEAPSGQIEGTVRRTVDG